MPLPLLTVGAPSGSTAARRRLRRGVRPEAREGSSAGAAASACTKPDSLGRVASPTRLRRRFCCYCCCRACIEC